MEYIKEQIENPKVSIILPTFNRGNVIKRSIESVLNQSYKNFELLIIDNFSKDNTFQIISDFNEKKIKYFKFNNHDIISKSRNYGIKNANGKYIAFLDSDDWWVSNKLEISLIHLQEGYDFIYHDLNIHYQFKKNNIKKTLPSWQVKSPISLNLIEKGSPICTSSVVLRKDLMQKINGFSESSKLVGAEDYDAWVRYSMYSEKFKYIKKALGFYNIGHDNMSNIDRDIATILYLNTKYKKIRNKSHDSIPVWMGYGLASAFLKKKNFKKSRFYSRKILFRKSRIDMFFKSYIIYFFSIMQKKL